MTDKFKDYEELVHEALNTVLFIKCMANLQQLH